MQTRSLKDLLVNIATYAGGDFLVLAVGGFLLIPLYTRHLSPSDYGVFVATRTNSEIFTYIVQLGIVSAISRVYFIFKATGQHRKYISSILIFSLASTAILLIGFGLTGKFLWKQLSPNVPAMPYMWFALGIAFSSYVPAIYFIILRVEERARAFVITQVASAVLLVAFALFWVLEMKMGLKGVLWALTLNGLISWIGCLILLVRKLEWGFEWEHLRISLKFGMPLLIGYLAYFFINRFGIVFLQRHVSLAEVGLFGFAQQLAMAVSLVSVAFGKSFQPMIFATEESEIGNTISRLSRIYLVFMVCVGAIVATFASEILRVIAPRAYAHAYYIFVLLLVSNTINTLHLISDSVILYRHRPALSMVVSISGSAATVLANMWLVPKFGVNGAIGSSLLASGVITAISFTIARKMVLFRVGTHVLWAGVMAALIVAFAMFMNGKSSVFVLIPIKIVLLSLLGATFYFLHLKYVARNTPTILHQQN